MKTIKEMTDIMLAFDRGEQIEFRYREIEWRDTNKPIWDWNHFDYRVKPKPKYAPFSTAEQFLEAQEKHGQAVIQIHYVNKDNTVCNQFRAYVNNLGNIVLYDGVNTVRLLTLEQLFNDYYFANDLAPCGKIID